MELHKQGHFPVDKLCKVYSVRDFETALSDLQQGKVSSRLVVTSQSSCGVLTNLGIVGCEASHSLGLENGRHV